MTAPAQEPQRPRVHPTVDRLAAYAWRLIVIGVVALAGVWLVRTLWMVLLTVVVTTYLTRILDGPNRWLQARLSPLLAALVSVLGFLALVGLGIGLLVPQLVEQGKNLGPTLDEAVHDIERWIVEDSPFDVTWKEVEDLEEEIGDFFSKRIESSGDQVVDSAMAFFEGFTAIVLALITTFFLLKDGPAFQTAALRLVPAAHQDAATRMARRAWATVGGYLRGVLILGTLEGIIIGVTMWLVGAELALPVGVLTLAAAFIPIVGAILAGVAAVLVTLATVSPGAALVVAAVALVVQQLDNDLLAPVIYGRSLQLHPLVVLFSIVVGGALFGVGGTILAVPVVAVVLNVLAEARNGDPDPLTDALTEGPDEGR